VRFYVVTRTLSAASPPAHAPNLPRFGQIGLDFSRLNNMAAVWSGDEVPLGVIEAIRREADGEDETAPITKLDIVLTHQARPRWS